MPDTPAIRTTRLTRDAAWELLTRYNKDAFHLHHAETVERTMRFFARELGYGAEEDYWGVVGMLHDIDFEQWPQEHCVRSQTLLRELGVEDSVNRAVASHGYAIVTDIAPEHEMEKVLYAVDELTGLLGAVVLMYPSKSAKDLNLKSVKKKFKDKKFAAGCSREVIQRGADLLGWPLDDLISRTIAAVQSFLP
ncbi:MAG: hydrolase [Kiritimatiellae bacterium]|nr:hydrolase [Kiritimatiellia bacterium]MBR1920669.1 hydrolase [Kiritimatiellia bacterium]